jgi:ABC-type multidrug transport system ATPase subunit
MKRRVNLAVALFNDPSILIMDGALVGIDIEQRQYILTCSKILHKRALHKY